MKRHAVSPALACAPHWFWCVPVARGLVALVLGLVAAVAAALAPPWQQALPRCTQLLFHKQAWLLQPLL